MQIEVNLIGKKGGLCFSLAKDKSLSKAKLAKPIICHACKTLEKRESK
jgi:hypothetical protein